MSVRSRAGERDQRIIIQAAATAQEVTDDDGSGDEVTAWSNLATVWASAEPLDGTEYGQPFDTERGGQQGVRFQLLYSSAVSGISSRHRIVWNSNTYDVQSVRDIDGRKTLLEVLAVRFD